MTRAVGLASDRRTVAPWDFEAEILAWGQEEGRTTVVGMGRVREREVRWVAWATAWAWFPRRGNQWLCFLRVCR